MKFTLEWLKDYLDTNASVTEISNKLDQLGLEVEEVVDKAEELKDFNVVFVEDCKKHPDSDHLNICSVVKADGSKLQIICGAPNVKAGVKAVLCPVGSTPPGLGTKITKSKIRGYESQGMLCSEKELGLGQDHQGIMLLSDDIQLGENIAKIKCLDNIIFEISLTPNRGDCLGVYGIARDLSATGIGTLKPIPQTKIEEKTTNPFKVKIEDENCPEFAIRYFKGVKNCESPDWLKKRLISVGFTPKTALVDITNYVMWTFNRPSHCYDADKINGDFVIKKSNGKEKYDALDKQTYILPENATLVSSSNGDILGLGGIIGGALTATEMTTTNIVFECALFEPISIAKTAKISGINTDAKYRFERAVDYANADEVINFASKLILEICGGEASDIVKEQIPNFIDIYNKRKIDFAFKDIKRVLGIEILKQNVEEILNKLGYEVKINGENISVLVPSWRYYYNDIPEVVIEDIIRVYGYDNLPPIPVTTEKIDEDQVNKINRERSNKFYEIHKLLAGNGLTEVISWSMINEKLASEFSLIQDNLRLLNPMIEDMAYLRPSMLPSMLNIVKYNNQKGINDVAIFENGVIFLGLEPQDQKRILIGMRSGQAEEKSIYSNGRMYDVFDVKKDLFDVLELFNINGDSLTITNDVPDYYILSKSAAVKMGDILLGVFGEIDPFKTAKFELKNKVNVFELYLDKIPREKGKVTQKKRLVLNELQPIFRDFAFIIDKNIQVGNILSLAKKTNKILIKEVQLFDIYEGKGIAQGKKSIAFSIKIQPIDNPLTTAEIDAISNKIIDDVKETFNAVLRDK